MTDLTQLRATLDEIDRGIHDLLLRRADVVADIGAQKKGTDAPRLRPGREAAILRRLLARHHGPLAPATIVRIWREIFAGSLALQGPLRVALAAPGLAPLAREHFGALVPLTTAASPQAALAALAAGEADAALIDADTDAWSLLPEIHPDLSIAAWLPIWRPRPEGGPTGQAFLVTPHFPDASGADQTLVALRPPGAPPALPGQSAAPRQAANGWCLAEMPSHLTSLPPGLPCPARLIGAYALPIA